MAMRYGVEDLKRKRPKFLAKHNYIVIKQTLDEGKTVLEERR